MFASNGGWFPYTRTKMDAGDVDFDSSTKKWMIVTATPDGTEEFVADLTELTTQSGYAAGFGQSGRVAATSAHFTFDTDVADPAADLLSILNYSGTPSWTALGTNGTTIVGLVLITEVTNDADSIPWIWKPHPDGSYTLTGRNEATAFTNPIAAIDANGE